MTISTTKSESEILREWYNNENVKFEIIKTMKFREFQIIRKNKGEDNDKKGGVIIRWLQPFSIGNYNAIMRSFEFDKSKANLYRGLEMYKIPMMSFVLERRFDQYKLWKKERESNPSVFLGGDLGFDLDHPSKKWERAIPDVIKLKSSLDKYGVRYAFWMSGRKGFHFIIPYEDMPQEVKQFSQQGILDYYKDIATTLKKDIKTLDTKTIYMPTRVFKCPYTVHESMNVILPLDNESFDALINNRLSLSPKDVAKNFTLGFRGIYLQKEKNESKFKDNLDRFIRDGENGLP